MNIHAVSLLNSAARHITDSAADVGKEHFSTTTVSAYALRLHGSTEVMNNVCDVSFAVTLFYLTIIICHFLCTRLSYKIWV